MRLLRSIVPVAIVAIAVSAWLQSRGISALLGERLAVADVAPRSADWILARNPFDSTTGSLTSRHDTEPASPSPGPADCSDVHVIAIAAADPVEQSLALLRVDGKSEPQLRAVGGDVVSIGPAGVLLDRAGGRCTARIFHPRAPSASSPPVPGSGITSTGPTSFAVDRGARDALLDGAGDWMKSVTVRPEKAGDDVVGIRVVALRPGSPLDGLGIRAGDVLESVNGFQLTTPAKMLEALARLRTADHLSLALQRAGHEVQVDYDVR